MYMAFKHFHLLMVVLSVSFLLVRFAMSLKPSALLQTTFFKIAPHVIDTLLLVSAIMLMVTIKQYPFVTPWLTEKLLGVIAYIVLAVMAMKGRTTAIRWFCLIGALGWLGLVARVAISKQPILFNAF